MTIVKFTARTIETNLPHATRTITKAACIQQQIQLVDQTLSFRDPNKQWPYTTQLLKEWTYTHVLSIIYINQPIPSHH